MDSLITVKTFTYAHEAAVVKSLLQSEDIFCFLKDELTIQANPFYSNALGGVKLQVKESDVATAMDILKRSGYLNKQAQQTISIKTATGEITECPACESKEIALVKKPSGLIFGLSLAFLGFPLTVFSGVYHCYNCGNDIKVSRL